MSPLRLYALPLLAFALLATGSPLQDARLTVVTDPEGVEVWLDDRYLGDSPIENRPLLPGQYLLKLVDPVRRVTVTETVVLRRAETTVVEKSMTGRFGTLRLSGNPSGAQAQIASVLGTTPLTNTFMNPGKYHLRIEHPSGLYEPLTEEVTIIAGQTVDVNTTLTRINLLDKKALLRLALGAGAAAGFIWAVVEQGRYRSADEKSRLPGTDPDILYEKRKEADRHAIRRTVGVAAGILCVLGFEIVAFF